MAGEGRRSAEQLKAVRGEGARALGPGGFDCTNSSQSKRFFDVFGPCGPDAFFTANTTAAAATRRRCASTWARMSASADRPAALSSLELASSESGEAPPIAARDAPKGALAHLWAAHVGGCKNWAADVAGFADSANKIKRTGFPFCTLLRPRFGLEVGRLRRSAAGVQPASWRRR